jgi:PPM family protein phosphatase
VKTFSIFHSDIGNGREINQDYIITSDESHIYVIADGIGGLLNGDVASQLAAQKMLAHLTNLAILDDYYNYMLRATILTNQFVYSYAKENYPDDKIGTTLTSLIFAESKYFISHIGDSRVYLFRNENLDQITKDQTEKEYLKNSSDKYSEIHLNSKKHILTQAVGIKETCTPIIFQGSVYIGDVFLLCTDGLYNLFSHGELTMAFCDHKHKLPELSKYLISTSLKNPRTDNISFIIVKFENNL